MAVSIHKKAIVDTFAQFYNTYFLFNFRIQRLLLRPMDTSVLSRPGLVRVEQNFVLNLKLNLIVF